MFDTINNSRFSYLIWGCLTLFGFLIACFPIPPIFTDVSIKIFNFLLTFLLLMLAALVTRKEHLSWCHTIFFPIVAIRLTTHYISFKQNLLFADSGDIIFQVGDFLIGRSYLIGACVYFLIAFTLSFLTFYCVKKTKTLRSHIQNRVVPVLGTTAIQEEDGVLVDQLRLIEKLIRFDVTLSILINLAVIIVGCFVSIQFGGMELLTAMKVSIFLGVGEGLVFLSLSFFSALSMYSAIWVLLEDKKEECNKFVRRSSYLEIWSKIELVIAGLSCFFIFVFPSHGSPFALILISALFLCIMSFCLRSFIFSKIGQPVILD